MRVQKLDNQDIYKTASYMMNLFRKAVKEAKEVNRKNGLPNDFVINGKRFYELPDGQIVEYNPLEEKK